MVEQTVFRGVVDFMAEIGVYDVILPFLLVFTIIFAILEKTKVLGVGKLKDGKEVTKKNLNSMVALVVSFLVIASTQLVAIISEVMANVVLLLILGICFLMLVGIFFGDKEFTFENFSGWTKFLMIFMFIGVVTIFLNALGWLEAIFGLFIYWDTEWASPIIFLLIILGFVYFITKEPSSESSKKE